MSNYVCFCGVGCRVEIWGVELYVGESVSVIISPLWLRIDFCPRLAHGLEIDLNKFEPCRPSNNILELFYIARHFG